LDACPARIIEADDRAASLGGQIHDLTDFLGVGAAQSPADKGKVLGKHKHLTAIDATRASNHTITRNVQFVHAEVCTTVGHKLVDFLKTTFIQEEFQTFPGRKLSGIVLALDAFFAAAELGESMPFI
jgi:hypothetical protein